jgi:hypothetical protein
MPPIPEPKGDKKGKKEQEEEPEPVREPEKRLPVPKIIPPPSRTLPQQPVRQPVVQQPVPVQPAPLQPSPPAAPALPSGPRATTKGAPIVPDIPVSETPKVTSNALTVVEVDPLEATLPELGQPRGKSTSEVNTKPTEKDGGNMVGLISGLVVLVLVFGILFYLWYRKKGSKGSKVGRWMPSGKTTIVSMSSTMMTEDRKAPSAPTLRPLDHPLSIYSDADDLSPQGPLPVAPKSHTLSVVKLEPIIHFARLTPPAARYSEMLRDSLFPVPQQNRASAVDSISPGDSASQVGCNNVGVKEVAEIDEIYAESKPMKKISALSDSQNKKRLNSYIE